MIKRVEVLRAILVELLTITVKVFKLSFHNGIG